MNGAQMAIEALRREGVRLVAGLPGTTIMHLIDAVGGQPGMRYISARHEQVAAFMADGYARASGTVGVCLASRGPGAANLAIGIHNAHAESIPVLALIGQVPDQVYHREAFEEMDLVRFFEPITKWSVEVHDPSRIPELLQRAVRTALSGRPGPVMVSLPLDVQTAEAAATFQPSVRSAPPAPQAIAVQEAAGLLATARRPVIIAGGGVCGPGYDPGLLQLAERLQIPVVTSWLRKNVFPNDCVLFCGSLGYGAVPVTENLVREADVVLAIGCRFSEFTTGRWTLLSPAASLIQVNIDADSLGRYYVPAIGICADAAEATAALAAAVGALGEDEARPARPGRRRPAMTAGEQQSARGLRAQRAAAAHAAYRQQTGLPAPRPVRHWCPPPRWSPPCARCSAGPAPRWSRTPQHGGVDPAAHRFHGPWHLLRRRGRQHGLGIPGGDGHAAGPTWEPDYHGERRRQLLDGRPGPGNRRPREPAGRERHQQQLRVRQHPGPAAVRARWALPRRLLRQPGFRRLRPAARGARGTGGVSGGLLPALDRALASGRPAIVDVIQDQYEGLPPGLLPPPAR